MDLICYLEFAFNFEDYEKIIKKTKNLELKQSWNKEQDQKIFKLVENLQAAICWLLTARQ